MSATIKSLTPQQATIADRQLCRSFGFEDDSGNNEYRKKYAYYDLVNNQSIVKNNYLVCTDKTITNSDSNVSTIKCLDSKNTPTNCCKYGNTLVPANDINAIQKMISCPTQAPVKKTCKNSYQTDRSLDRNKHPKCINGSLPKEIPNSKSEYPDNCYCDCSTKPGFFGKDCGIQSGCVDSGGNFTKKPQYLCQDGFRQDAAKIVYQITESDKTVNKYMTIDSHKRIHADPIDNGERDHAWFRFYKLGPSGYSFLLKHECGQNRDKMDDKDNCWCKAGPDPAGPDHDGKIRTVITCNNEHPYNKSMDEIKDYIFTNERNNQFGRPAGKAADSTLGHFRNQGNYYCTPKYTSYGTDSCPAHTYVQYDAEKSTAGITNNMCATPYRDATLLKTNSTDYNNRGDLIVNRCDYHTEF